MKKLFVIDKTVFFGSLVFIFLFLSIGIFFPSEAERIFSEVQGYILYHFGWLYLLSVSIILVSMLLFSLGRFGQLKLGPDDSEPDFGYISWIAMLFSAGMGIGLMFYAVGEPLTHFMMPPTAQPRSVEAMREAMAVTFFHWGIHAWAIYAVVGLSLAYFGYRYNLPLTIRSGLYPLLKDRINGPIGHAVDIFAIVGTMFGIATSLGLGVSQINAGLNYLFGLEFSPTVQIAIIVVVTAISTTSVVVGIDRGIKKLSEINLLVAILLMLFVLVVGPTSTLLRDFVQNIGLYLDSVLLRTFNIYAYEPTPWVDNWTLFYWAWWISWSPFVGMFIARISRGRTVREFVAAVLFVPSGFTFFWMTVFGDTALHLDVDVAGGQLAQQVVEDVSIGLFQFFSYLPLPFLTSVVSIILVAIFFITSSDSGSLVIDTISAGGATQTTTVQRVFWCSLEGVVAACLLVAGGLSALQSATIASALPFSLVLLALTWALYSGMRADLAQRNARANASGALRAQPFSEVPWQKRLSTMLRAPTSRDVNAFIERVVGQALNDVAEELARRNRVAQVRQVAETGGIELVVPNEGVRDFVYGVLPATRPVAAFSMVQSAEREERWEAKTYFSDGSKGYDLMGMTKEQILADILYQFERYLALVQLPDSRLVTTAPEHSAEI